MRHFKMIVNSPYGKEIKQDLLQGKSIKEVRNALVPKGLDVSAAYLKKYRTFLEKIRASQTDAIIEELRAEGLINYVSKISFLKSIVAKAFRDTDKVTVREGLDAAKILMESELKLRAPLADKMREAMGRWFTEVPDKEIEDAEVREG